MINIRSGEAIPEIGWGEVIHASQAGLTQGTTTLIAGGNYTTWIKSWHIVVDTAAVNESAVLQTSTGLTIAAIPLDNAVKVDRQYVEGWPVPAGEDIEIAFDGNNARLNVAVEVIRKLANNAST